VKQEVSEQNSFGVSYGCHQTYIVAKAVNGAGYEEMPFT
jgi:hypothetical protein